KGQTLTAALNAGSNVVRAVSLTAEGGPNLDRLDVNDGLPAAVDWGRALVDSTMKRFPTASDLGGWEYSRGFFLYGAYQVYQRTRDPRYLRYIEDWVDAHVSDSGAIDAGLPRLDNFLPGNLLVALFRETGRARYRRGADTIRRRFDSYP